MTTTRCVPSATARFRADVLAGLSRPQKRLPAKYFYDAAGSRLFDRICELPEYYPTRTELGILGRHADAMAGWCGSGCLLVELGAGSLRKVRHLLDRLESPAGYVPVDVSGDHLAAAARALADGYPGLPVRPVVADFTAPFDLPLPPARRRVVYFPGSTLGNFEPAEADALLRRVARLVGPGGGLILGVDLRKPAAVLEPAYNDAAGVTAAFNRNLLVRINRELGGDFDPAAFAHRAFYNAGRSRVEMHLVSGRRQRVRVGRAAFDFRPGETIHTENSHKYDRNELAGRAAGCGLRLAETWADERGYFAVLGLTAQPPQREGWTMKAEWNGAVLAESDDTVVVEGNHYFPPDALRAEHFRPSSTRTVCGWKGTARYYTVVVGGRENPDAAWYYPEPTAAARLIAGRVAFWKGVTVTA
ncbi:MAG: L-histidine N(alpha)-methyltransferase [Gemmataceae bacterium]